MNDRLYRSRSDRMLAGVAGGVAERFDLDPSLVRVGCGRSSSILTGGIFLLIYIVMAIVVPEEPVGVRSAGRAPVGWSGSSGLELAAGRARTHGRRLVAGGPAPVRPPAPPPQATDRASRRHGRRRPGRSARSLVRSTASHGGRRPGLRAHRSAGGWTPGGSSAPARSARDERRAARDAGARRAGRIARYRSEPSRQRAAIDRRPAPRGPRRCTSSSERSRPSSTSTGTGRPA